MNAAEAAPATAGSAEPHPAPLAFAHPRASQRGLPFTKMHGAGNDFVLLDLRGNAPAPDIHALHQFADRHRGVGCDQIIGIVDPVTSGSIAGYRIWNADGSPAQQCGNGARCVAAWLRRAGAVRSEDFMLDSPVGAHAVRAHGAHDFSIDLGVPDFAPARIPLAVSTEQPDYWLDVQDVPVRFGAVSMGNPHAVVEVPDISAAPLHTLGAAMQAIKEFPEGVNVGFAQVQENNRIALRVFERGVGETLACGSGACAAVAVLVRQGRIGRDVAVVLLGGTLHIAWPSDDAPVNMRGPAAFVFEGEWHP